MLMYYIDGLVQERHNYIANALELRLSCTNPSVCPRLISATIFIRHAYHVFSSRPVGSLLNCENRELGIPLLKSCKYSLLMKCAFQPQLMNLFRIYKLKGFFSSYWSKTRLNIWNSCEKYVGMILYNMDWGTHKLCSDWCCSCEILKQGTLSLTNGFTYIAQAISLNYKISMSDTLW